MCIYSFSLLHKFKTTYHLCHQGQSYTLSLWLKSWKGAQTNLHCLAFTPDVSVPSRRDQLMGSTCCPLKAPGAVQSPRGMSTHTHTQTTLFLFVYCSPSSTLAACFLFPEALHCWIYPLDPFWKQLQKSCNVHIIGMYFPLTEPHHYLLFLLLKSHLQGLLHNLLLSWERLIAKSLSNLLKAGQNTAAGMMLTCWTGTFSGDCTCWVKLPLAEEVFSGSRWRGFGRKKNTLHFSHKCHENIHQGWRWVKFELRALDLLQWKAGFSLGLEYCLSVFPVTFPPLYQEES